ncbi:MAG TPA: glycosyltransferase family 9 protein [Micrococcaceae bacterium]|jgi:ADP-heptose:LPS heptosyltransferase|nr:glycosyltransferase family 9 protein [Micrococcaceae bacterium]
MSRRVLVARLDSMGDVLLCGPAVRAVASMSDHVAMLCGPLGSAAAALLPGVDEVIVWDCPWIANPAPEATRGHLEILNDELRQVQADQAVILTSFHQSPLPLALMLKMAGMGPVAGASVDYPGSLLDVRLRPGEDLPEDIPEPVRALAIARAAGFELPAGDDGLLAIRDVGGAAHLAGGAPYVVVHPGAEAPARAWPAELNAACVELLAAAGYRVVVTGSQDEAMLTRRVAGSSALDLGGLTDLRGLAAVLAGAQAVVVGNTGPAHLAAAVGTPVVSLFSPVVPAVKWAPYGVPLELLGDQDAACRNSRVRECPIPGHPCLSGVQPAAVVDAVRRLTGPAVSSAMEVSR